MREWAISLLFLAAALIAAPSRAQEERDQPKIGIRLAAYDAMFNGAASALVAGRYGGDWGVRFGFWARHNHIDGDAPHVFAGVDRRWTEGRWRFGLGAVWIDKESRINGTRWNFDPFLSYDLSDKVFVEFLHISHGSELGIERSTPNRGWNFIGLGTTF